MLFTPKHATAGAGRYYEAQGRVVVVVPPAVVGVVAAVVVVAADVSFEQPGATAATSTSRRRASRQISLLGYNAFMDISSSFLARLPQLVAEWEGFEPSRRVTPAYTISSRAP